MKGWTALMSAAENGHLDFARWLLDKGASVNQAMESGWTAMHSAAKNDNKEMVRLLLKRGGDQTLKATHRDFGRNLLVEDVTVDEDVLALLADGQEKQKEKQNSRPYYGHSHGY